MSSKGISWIEANFEKLIVAIMLVAFLAVLIFQFVLSSNTVDVGGSKVSLADAFKPAERAAEVLQSRLSEPSPALPEQVETRDLAADFERKISGGVIDIPRFLAIAEPLALEASSEDTNFAAAEFAPFQPPAPSVPTAAGYRATLDPYAVAQIEGLADALPSEQPLDTAWVSVQGVVPGSAIRAAYENDPDGPSGVISPLPSSWWSQGVGILAVETDRQRRDVEGNWGAAEPVARMPGTLSLIDNLDTAATNYRQLEAIGAQAARNEDVILRPEFVHILEGESWVPPVEVPAAGDIGSIKSQIRTLERRIASIDRDIEQKRSALTNRPADTRGGEGGGHGGGGGGETGGGRETRETRETRRQPETETTQADARTRSIENQIARLTTQRTDTEKQLTALGWQPTETRGIADAYDRAAYVHAEPLLDSSEVHFWVHDLAVEPGATYRYRTRLVFVNPLFGRKSSLDESLHELADAKLVRSDWSEWSEPVGVSWDEYFFLTGAAPGETGNIGKTSATAELYRFYYGYWRKSVVSLEPGDRFVAEIDLPEGLQKWDVARPADAQAWKPPAETPEVGSSPTEAVEQVEGLEELLLPTKIAVSADAWLLDVVASPVASTGIGGQSALSYEALVRGPDGQITSRSPTLDAKEPLLAVIKASADAGKDQLPRIPGQAPRQARGLGRDGFGGDPGGGHGGGGHGGGGRDEFDPGSGGGGGNSGGG